MAQPYLNQLKEFFSGQALQDQDTDLECRHFFSGAAMYVDGRICMTLTPVGLGLKLPQQTRERLLQEKRAVPLRYFEKSPLKKDYVLFPDGLEDAGPELKRYILECIRYAVSDQKD